MAAEDAELDGYLDSYFDAKARMYRHRPEFRVFRAGPLRGFHKHPGWVERDAFYAWNLPARDVVAHMKAANPHPQHALTVLTQPTDEHHQSAFAALGYRTSDGVGQPFMVRQLSQADGTPPNNSVRIITPDNDLDLLQSLHAVVEPGHLGAADIRGYVIEEHGEPVCTGMAVYTSNGGVYVAGLETRPDARRRGLATHIMQCLHADAAAAHCTHSVLCSTPVGFMLYLQLGYKPIAFMRGFVPNSW